MKSRTELRTLFTIKSNVASQPQWELGSQLEVISQNQSCPTGKGQLDCLRTKDGFALQAILLSSGNQFQPVIDNITIFKDYVKQTKEGRTAKIPLLIGTNKVWRRLGHLRKNGD